MRGGVICLAEITHVCVGAVPSNQTSGDVVGIRNRVSLHARMIDGNEHFISDAWADSGAEEFLLDCCRVYLWDYISIRLCVSILPTRRKGGCGTEEKEMQGLAGSLTVERDVIVAVADDEGGVGGLLPGECSFLGWGAGKGRVSQVHGCAACNAVTEVLRCAHSTSKSAVTRSIGASRERGSFGAVAYGHAEQKSRICKLRP
jgi:hypothetical protein